MSQGGLTMRYVVGADADPATGTRIENDTILPAQFHRSSKGQSGPHRLLFAMLADAIDLLWHPPHTSKAGVWQLKRTVEDARQWVTARDTSHLCCFENVCWHLGLNPQRARAAILRRHAHVVAQQSHQRLRTLLRSERQPDIA